MFTFDRYGNRRFDEANTTMPTSFSNQALTNPTISTSNNRLTSTGWTYDSAGNTIGDPDGRSFIYDAENKQVEVKNSSNASIGTYFFDGDGKRVKKVVPSTGETTVFVYDASGKQIAEYSTNLSPTPQVQYLTKDNLGTPRINTDRDGSVVSRTDYMPYGEEINSGVGGRTSGLNYASPDDDVRQKFTGYQKDSETSLDFAEARMYESRVGRFTATDPIQLSKGHPANPQKWNLYVYVNNNPLNLTDPDGRKPKKTIDVFVNFEGDESERQVWRKIEKSAPKGVKITVYFVSNGHGGSGDATRDNFLAALRKPNNTVIYVGHSIMSPAGGEKNARHESIRGLGDGIGLADGMVATKAGALDKNSSQYGSAYIEDTTIKARNFAWLSCDSGQTFAKMKSDRQTDILWMDPGKDGYASTVPTVQLIAQKMVGVFANGGDAAQAKDVAQGVLDANPYDAYLDGDKMMHSYIK